MPNPLGRAMRFSFAATALLSAVMCQRTSAATLIVGGHPINITEAPWQLALIVEQGNGLVVECGAVWIGGPWILTAAHCVETATTENTFIFAGISRRSEMSASNALHVNQITPNPDFPFVWKDLAIIRLASDITSPLAKPIRYATQADVTAGLTRPGASVFATGWGKTSPGAEDLPDRLYGVTSTILDTTRYQIDWAGAGGTANIGACEGDSGGPLAVKDAGGVSILAGISSTISSFCGDPNSPSAYTRVSSLTDFIRSVTGITNAIGAIPNPGAAAGNGSFLFLTSRRFRLTSSQTLDLTLTNISGAAVSRITRYYPAGEYIVPISKVAAGVYILHVQSKEFGTSESFSIRY